MHAQIKISDNANYYIARHNIAKHDMGYEVVLANTEESKNIHFNLRYQIYCIEKGFEEASKFPNELEIDDYDDRAKHFLIRQKSNNQWIGTFRLIIDKFDKLPIYHNANISHSHLIDPHKIYAEFSRLAIIRPFQKFREKQANHLNELDSCIVSNTISTGIEYCRRSGANRIYFFCPRSIIRFVQKLGIKSNEIGDKTLYRGKRYPYNVDLSDFPHRLFETNHAFREYSEKNTLLHYRQASEFESTHQWSMILPIFQTTA